VIAVFLVPFGLSLVCLVDAVRRPVVAWVAADRNKGWWVGALVVSAMIVIPAPVIVPAYLLGVLPMFPRGQEVGAARQRDKFAKSSISAVPRTAAGWYPDPSGRAEHRWFDGERWTHDIVIAGVQQRDAI
jgi:hypothetical protein